MLSLVDLFPEDESESLLRATAYLRSTDSMPTGSMWDQMQGHHCCSRSGPGSSPGVFRFQFPVSGLLQIQGPSSCNVLVSPLAGPYRTTEPYLGTPPCLIAQVVSVISLYSLIGPS